MRVSLCLLLAVASCSSRSVVTPDQDAALDAARTDLARADAGAPDLPPDHGLPDLAPPPDMGPPPDGAACKPLPFTTLKHPAFYGHCGCHGVPFNRVITSAAQAKLHVAHYCAATFCATLPPTTPCPAPPAVDYGKQTLLYAYGLSSHGCEVAHSIDSVLECGSHLRVHYTAGGYDTTPLTCEAAVMASASALVAKTSLPVHFIRSAKTY